MSVREEAVRHPDDAAAGPPRDLAGWLRAQDDATLRTLLRDRPDLITPVPADLAALAARASTPGAVARVLDTLDTFTLTIVEMLLVLPSPFTYDELAHGLAGASDDGEPDDRLRDAVDRLRALLLAWGDDDAMWPVPALADVITHPMGLGPPASEAFAGYPEDRLAQLAADLRLPEAGGPPLEIAQGIARTLADPDRLAALLDDAGPEAREALDRLAWGPPVGSVSGAWRTVRVETAASPIERLLARGLLAASGDHSVVLPREVALYLRGGRLMREPVPAPPEPSGRAHDLELVDHMAAGEAFTLVRGIEDLLELWGVTAPGVLRSGGLAVRDLRRAAEELDVPEWVAALYAELAYAAGLLSVSETVDGEWLPTVAYDLWRGRELPDRWAELARAWLATTRVPGLAGERDDRDRAYNALGDGLDRGGAPETRRRVLRALADAPPGVPLGPDDVRAQLDWWRPRRRGRFRDLMVDTVLREAERLGFTGRGALAGYARALLDGEAAARDALAAVLPEPVDHVLLQADLTAVAPGRLTPDLARELALAADVESTGGATVYRFGETSVRRALDAGRTAEELDTFLERHSRTPVPQPLRYLISDVARRHGRIRVGTASAYVRCDDPATLDELLAGRHAASLGLHRIAPTVLVSRTSRGALLDTIRAAGYAPMGESFDGDLVITRPDAQRAPERPRSRPAETGRRAAPDDEVLTAAVRAIRAGDEAATAVRRPISAPGDEPPRSAAAATIAALSQAVQAGRRVWIGYLDAQGQASSRIVEPARVEGGYLTAYDATRAAVHRFSLHRITGVAAIDESGVAAET